MIKSSNPIFSFRLKNNGPNYITVRFDKQGKIWCVTPENILRILDIDSTKEKESLIHNTLMKGEQNTVKSKKYL